MSRSKYLGLALAGMLACGGPAPGPPDEVVPAPIQTITGSDLQALVEARRGRVVLINLWATWCSPCLKEIPELIHLQNAYRNRGLELIAVAMDDPMDLESQVIPFRDRLFPEWETYQRSEAEMDAFVSAIDSAWNEILPTSYLLDRDGNIARILSGGKSYEQFEAAVLQIL